MSFVWELPFAPSMSEFGGPSPTAVGDARYSIRALWDGFGPRDMAPSAGSVSPHTVPGDNCGRHSAFERSFMAED